jgi:hypothetical protein
VVVERRAEAVQEGDGAEPWASGCGAAGVTRHACGSAQQPLVLPITVEITDAQMTLPRHHRDPFDRLLVAQCLVESMPIVSADSVFDAYGVTRVWA